MTTLTLTGPSALAGLDDIVSCSLNPTSVYGTDTSAGEVVVSGFTHGGTVLLYSSEPSAASVPASVAVSFRNQAHFTVNTFPVDANTNVTITALYNGSRCDVQLLVRPPILTAISFNPNPVRGGDNSIATITLNRPAPADWLYLIQGPTPPIDFLTGSVVAFNAGATSTTKTINTQEVNFPVNALITVRPSTGQAPNVSATLSVVPTQPQTLTLAPSSMTVGGASLGCVTLNGPALLGGATVVLESDNPAVASVPPSVFIPSGDSDGCFIVQSHEIDTCGEAVISAAAGGQTVEATLKVGHAEQITDNAVNDRWNNRHSSTVDGKVLWTDEDSLFFNDGVSTQIVQARGDLDAVSLDVIGLGTGAAPGEVIGAWRRGTDFGWVWRSGFAPVAVSVENPFDPKEPTNPQAIAIADGAVFMVVQSFFNANAVKHVYRVDPVTGNTTSLSGALAVPGASRAASDDGQAAWLFVDSATPKLQFFDGSGVSTIDEGEIDGFRLRIARGRIIYQKLEEGVNHIFLYDTTVENPTPVRLSPDTDVDHGHFAPATDGYHVAWLFGDADGTDVDIMLSGGLLLNDENSRPAPVGFEDHPIQLNRGQVLWKDAVSGYQFAAEGTIEPLCVTPAASFAAPWLADGFIAGFGPQGGSLQTDNEVFVFPGPAPSDDDLPLAPLILRSTPTADRIILEWDAILGADAYAVHVARVPGVTRENYASLPGGRRVDGIVVNAASVCDIPNGVPHFVTVSTVEAADEGGPSLEIPAMSQPFASLTLDEIRALLPCLAGPNHSIPPPACRAFDFALADFNCDLRFDLNDVATILNLVTP